jgi:hypothetical protein
MEQWSLLLFCLNQRAVHLTRTVPLALATDAFVMFDHAITEHIMKLMQIPEPDQNQAHSEWYDQVHTMRGLPIKLSGGSMTKRGDPENRVRALRLARDNILRYCAAHEPDMTDFMKNSWSGNHPYQFIKPHDDYDAEHRDEDDPMSAHLKGHTIGNIPNTQFETRSIGACPTIDEDRNTAREVETDRQFAMQLKRHTEVLEQLRSSQQQYKKQLAAQVLSSSCVNSGNAIRRYPTGYNYIRNSQFIQALRLCFGIPCAFPLHQWRCNCKGQGGYQHRDFHINCEGTASASFEDEPLHGLGCRRRWRKAMQRHDNIRDALTRVLNQVQNVTASIEPRVEDEGQRRADIKVTKNGVVTYLDIGVTCPASRNKVTVNQTHLVPGAAAAAYHVIKANKYANLPADIHYLPFIVETGGRLHIVARDFINQLIDKADMQNRGLRSKAFSAISSSLCKDQSHMLATIVKQIAMPDVFGERDERDVDMDDEGVDNSL